MKKTKWYERGKKQICAMFLLCAMLFMMGGTVDAGDYKEDRTGSIGLTLAATEDGQTEPSPIPEILLSLYKVGSAETEGAIRFVLDERLADTEVDFSDMSTPEQVRETAQKLEAAVADSGIEPVSARTDLNGKVFFDNLEKGMYLIVQGDGEKICRIAPMLLAVPYSEDGIDWDFDIEANPKAEWKDVQGNLTVEKRILFPEGNQWVEKNVKDMTFYVGLFLDEDATIPYGDIRSIRIQDGSRGIASWTDLPRGTYYLRETDSKGNAVPLNTDFIAEDGNRVNCAIKVNDETTTRLVYERGGEENQNAVVENRYPEGYTVVTGDNVNLSEAFWGVLISGIVIISGILLMKKDRKLS